MQGRFILVTSLVLGSIGCDCGAPERTCARPSDCAVGLTCVDARCVPIPDAPGFTPDAVAPMVDAPPRPDAVDCAMVCAGNCCTTGQLCFADTCVTPRGTGCTTSEDCPGDTYCAPDAPGGPACIPFGVPASRTNDPMCTRLVAAGTFAPTVQCEFREAPEGDAFPMHLHVLSTPMVADFAIGRAPDAPRRPSIIAVFDDGSDGGSEQPTGVIRILDGATCRQSAELGSLQMVSHSSPPAVGDLDGDGRPEIVAYKAGGGLVAFHYDVATSRWGVLWRSTNRDGTPYNATGGGWAGPTIADLDDDGVPEILRGAAVLSATGVYLGGAGTVPSYNNGIFAVALDVDADGRVEYVAGDAIREWDPAMSRWDPDSNTLVTQTPGHVAVADFGDFPGPSSLPATTPEIAVIRSGTARIQTIAGTIVFGPITMPGSGNGGPPTIGDFDGDGLPEFASAGGTSYTVFDPDCSTTPRPAGVCASGTTTGVLWTRRSQDGSSNVTGSSIFDFEGDGAAEAVYGDECFIRVYAGATGNVLFSQSRSSCTWYENPVIADLDGDYNAEIVIGDNFNCATTPGGVNCSGFGLGPRNTDPLFPGLRCAAPEDCLSGVCTDGFCRCTSDDQCCSGAGCDRAAFVCETPPAGTPGTGNTCRASRPTGTRGIRVYRDGADRWVNSRAIWNQHAYSVTNVDESGRIPRTSEARANWLDAELNNFRQNVQGERIPGASPDLTTGGTPLDCDGTVAQLQARICNRGTEPVGSGVSVGFYIGDPAAGGRALCEGSSVGDLRVGQCELVTCSWAEAPTSPAGAVDIYVVADSTGVARECRESNNINVFRGVYCGVVF